MSTDAYSMPPRRTLDRVAALAGRSFVCLLLGLLLTWAGTLPAAAKDEPMIIPGQSVGDIHLGDSKDRVIEVLGNPELIGDTDTKPKSFNYQYFKKKMYVNVLNDKVGWIMCLSGDYHLKGGAGIGSSMTEIEAALGTSYQRKDGNAGPELTYPSGVRVLFYQDRVLGIEVRPAKP